MSWGAIANIRGPQGTQGVQGPKGDTGATGAPGASDWNSILNKPLVIGAGGTQALARSALGLKTAAVADILGTVSQSAGVPTGSIIQRGSNANGEFVRFADGTQICLGAFTRGTSSVAAFGQVQVSGWAYPATFAATPSYLYVVPIEANSGYFYARCVKVNSSNVGSIYLTNTGNGAYTTPADFKAIAFGRWF